MQSCAIGPSGLSTNEFAELMKVKPQSIRHQLCVAGSYFGIRPERLPNDKLIWPMEAVNELLSKKVAPRARPVSRTREAA